MFIKKSFGITDKGLRREKNEDCFLIDEQKSIFMVADGMGGHNAGEIASQLVCQYFSKYFESNVERIEQHFLDNFKKINQIIYQEAQKKDALKGMGTTFIVCCVDEQYAHFCHVGDVRAYYMRNDKLKKITEDHSTIALLLKNNLISEEEVKSHPLRGKINKAIGIEKDVEPDYNRLDIRGGDQILLCSDGLWNMLDDEFMFRILKKDITTEEKCLKLLNEANRAGGKDNITAILIEFQ